MRVVETFSGIGSQAKALKNIGEEYEIVATVEWDIGAIYAYDIIHNGKQENNFSNFTKDELIELLSAYTLSNNGKVALEYKSLKVMSKEVLERIFSAIQRTKNLVSITDVKACDLPESIDLLTYSFPCQDLSICGAWHGNQTGINRGANNRSGMLWEIERILQEYVCDGIELPKFLLMENVSNILSKAHKDNFEEWQNYLESIGYYNKVYTLDSINFGLPQRRKRTYMISVFCGEEDWKFQKVNKYFEEHNLVGFSLEPEPLEKYLRMDYKQKKYKIEADISNPNDTPSRAKIFAENDILWEKGVVKKTFVKTITTKQDRNPNSGVLVYDSKKPNKAPYRNLTPRECFLLMGFEEDDFQSLMDFNFKTRKNSNFFSRERLIKLAGNSIAVPVLEYIFKQIIEIRKIFYQ